METENSRFTILVAEDEPEVRKYLGFALKKHGYNVEFAGDGAEALTCLRTTDVSLVLMDIIMPVKAQGLDWSPLLPKGE